MLRLSSVQRLMSRTSTLKRPQSRPEVIDRKYWGCLHRQSRAKSYVKGADEPPLLGQTIPDNFKSVVSGYGDHEAVVSCHQGQRLTYYELDCKSNGLARGLASQGIQKGDRVAVSLGNNIEHTIVTFALYKLGAILVPLNPVFTTMQVISAVNHIAASHLIIGKQIKIPRKGPRSNMPLISELLGKLHSPTLEGQSAVPSLKSIIVVNNDSGQIANNNLQGASITLFESLVSDIPADQQALPPQNLKIDDIINIQFTSGTTSNPKAACLTHKSLLNNAIAIGDRMQLTPEDIVCSPPPLFHCFGCVIGFLGSTTHASTFVLPSESFDAEASLRAIQEEKCTALHGVPTMFIQMLDLITAGRISNSGFTQLRTGVAAGSSIPAELMKRLHQVLNLTELTICYGMTETSPVSFMTTPDDLLEKKLGTVGKLLPHVEAKVVNPVDHSRIVDVGEKGELAVSGYLLMKEYWQDPERTAEVMIPDAEGKIWMHSGDEATLSQDGYLTITGRIKDIIIRGGENIHPLEIENCLLAHPGVSDVSVVGVPDNRYGEVTAAFVMPRAGTKSINEADVKNWVSKRLSRHLVPEYVFIEPEQVAIPKTGSGKVQKFLLRERAIELLKGRSVV
ncbi:AMP-dependent synthetase/ligase [Ascosphaera apis ARSEF 7405]|uniref:AMP-dependent synthetase/ligase n=1 Tax=Ascosphaera apis ARSEF 7405 TaxID=392613 RepID=A0A167WTD5_9EURO|nr:AMP-dependent synthetase/ligase [Ascosphaera apis ARSEF 7405]